MKVPKHVRAPRRQDARDTFGHSSFRPSDDRTVNEPHASKVRGKQRTSSNEHLEGIPPTLTRRRSLKKSAFGMRKKSVKEPKPLERKATPKGRRDTLKDFLNPFKKDEKDDGDEEDVTNSLTPVLLREGRREVSEETPSIGRPTLPTRNRSWASGDSTFLTAKARKKPSRRGPILGSFPQPPLTDEFRIDVNPDEPEDEKTPYATASEGSEEVNISAISAGSRRPTATRVEDKAFMKRVRERQLAASTLKPRSPVAKAEPEMRDLDVGSEPVVRSATTLEQQDMKDSDEILSTNTGVGASRNQDVEHSGSIITTTTPIGEAASNYEEESVSPTPPSRAASSPDSLMSSIQSSLSLGADQDDLDEPSCQTPPKVSTSGARWRNGHKNFFPPWAKGMAQEDVVRIVLKQQRWRSESSSE